MAKPPKIEDVRLTLATLIEQTAQPPPPPAPPSSPSAARTRRSIRRRKSSLFSAELLHSLHPDGQVVLPAARSRTAGYGHLLDAMTVEPVLRGRAKVQVANNCEEPDMETEFPVISSRQRVVDQSTSSRGPPTRPLASWSRPSTMKTFSVQQLNVPITSRDDNDAAGQCSAHAALRGRKLFADGQKQQAASLPRQMALRRNRSEKSTVVRGLPSKTVQTRHQLQSTSQSSKLPVVSLGTY